MNPFSLALSKVSSWLADDTMLLGARSGSSLGPEVYDSLDSRMTSAPLSLMVAYEQSIYFLSLALRRAMRERTPTASLEAALNAIVVEADQAHEDISWLCGLTGFGCPIRGTVGILDETIDAIESAGLPQDDEVQITSILKRNKLIVQVKEVAPVVVAFVSVGIGLVWWKRGRHTW